VTQAERPAPAAPRPELSLDGVTLHVYRNSDPQLFARASHLELMRSTGALTAEDVHFDFLTDALTLEAPRLSGNLVSATFDVEGGPRLASVGVDPENRMVATTSSAHFEARAGAHGVASGAQPVDLQGLSAGRSYSLTAERFRFDLAEQHVTFDAVRSKVGAR
jgi:hypothetical protein